MTVPPVRQLALLDCRWPPMQQWQRDRVSASKAGIDDFNVFSIGYDMSRARGLHPVYGVPQKSVLSQGVGTLIAMLREPAATINRCGRKS